MWSGYYRNRIIDVEIETKFQQSGQQQEKLANISMLKLLPSEILCSDEVDETYSTSKWNKKALGKTE